MNKIVHVCLTGGYTEGINYQENYLTKFQAKLGYDVYILTTQYCWHKNIWGPCHNSDYKNVFGVTVIRLPYKYNVPYKINTYLGVFKGFYEELEKIDPDIIFVHNLQFQDLRKLNKYKKNHPNVLIYADNHSDFSNSARGWISRNILYKFYWKNCAISSEKIIKKFYGVLPARVDFLINVFKLPKDKCSLLVMGADDDAIEHVNSSHSRKRIREKYNIEENDLCVVTGGKIDSYKLQTLSLMEAIRNIDFPSVKLLVFGSVEKELQDRFYALCDGKKVVYLGWANSIQSYEYFSAADLVAFPGRHSVYWEQVAGMGIPIMCKYWEGTTHVDFGGNVYFLKEDSVSYLEKEIKDILTSERYNNMKEIASSSMKDKFLYSKISLEAIEMMN